MTNQEEESIIKIAGKEFSYQDIPTFIRERDNLPKPSDPTAPYNTYYCPKCSNEITFDKVSDGYFGVCENCDEDFYEFELMKKINK